MRDISTHRTNELPPEARAVLEQLLGRPLADQETVTLLAAPPQPAQTEQERKEAWRRLDEHLDLMASQVKGPTEDVEQFFDELCDEVRHQP